MNLEVLLGRVAEIEKALINMANQYQILLGHKAEAQHWIDQLQAPAPENKPEEAIVNPEEAPVE